MRVPREFVRGLCMRVVGSICCECTEVSRRNDPETDRDFHEDRFSAEDAEDGQSTQRTRLRAEGAPFPRVLRATSASRALKNFAYASKIPAARPAIRERASQPALCATVMSGSVLLQKPFGTCITSGPASHAATARNR